MKCLMYAVGRAPFIEQFNFLPLRHIIARNMQQYAKSILQLYCCDNVHCSCAQITRGNAANLIAADNMKVSLKFALDSKLITQANTTILFFAFRHPVNSGKDRK